ncbi:hypothetical protein N7414_04885 [Pseudomonas sp. GD04087]|uniref:hypothetical protein n=1 Tax=Pseudomonas TaxID=286 RepID=UPI001F305D76|nr:MULTISPECIES: hypothetical protein [Pseudomonas]EEZ3329104.1 hypothetical protein [Escherichia coli]MDH0288439.1 hypothetical protein [Pseudomonas sp. GD04087]MDH1048592.1 hypothetical protein [Pseudomonas sp. GD03903]MDH2000903.1 hypothetical protein [Pseudomonas sp. GD03691]
MNSGTNSQVQVARIDVWSRIFLAGALLLLLVNQVQLQMQVSRVQAASTPVAYVPTASSTPGLYREASRYPQAAPARNQPQVLQAPQAQTQAQVQPMARPQGGWVF